MNTSSSARKQYDFIPPEKSSAKARVPAKRRTTEIVDVEFEVIRTPMKAYYRVLNDNVSRRGESAGRRSGKGRGLFRSSVGFFERLLRRLGPRSFATVVGTSFALVFGAVLYLAGGEAVEPATLPAGGVAISGVDTSVIDSNGLRILEITGRVENLSGHDLPAPRLAAEVEEAGDSPSIVVFNLDEPVLSGGKTVPFTLKLPHPGGKVPKVRVSADAGAF